MESSVICLDTSALIDYYRKKDKSKSFFLVWLINMTNLQFQQSQSLKFMLEVIRKRICFGINFSKK